MSRTRRREGSRNDRHIWLFMAHVSFNKENGPGTLQGELENNHVFLKATL